MAGQPPDSPLFGVPFLMTALFRRPRRPFAAEPHAGTFRHVRVIY